MKEIREETGIENDLMQKGTLKIYTNLCLLKIPSDDFGAGCSDSLVCVTRTRTGYCLQGR